MNRARQAYEDLDYARGSHWLRLFADEVKLHTTLTPEVIAAVVEAAEEIATATNPKLKLGQPSLTFPYNSDVVGSAAQFNRSVSAMPLDAP